MDTSKLPALIFVICLAVIATAVAVIVHWPGLNFSIAPTQLMSVLSPLLLAAGFIERAVEVVVSPWRNTGASMLQKAVDVARAAADSATLLLASAALDKYKAKTQQIAFATSLTFGFAVSIVGVRTLWPLLAPAVDPAKAVDTASKLASVSLHQSTAFTVVDILLTAALLAGGADGIHSVVTAFTSFFDASAKKSGQAAAS
jgi:hypothetical protein